MTARFCPNAIVTARMAAIRAILPARVEFCKPVTIFILSDLLCNRRAAGLVSQFSIQYAAPALHVQECEMECPGVSHNSAPDPSSGFAKV